MRVSDALRIVAEDPSHAPPFTALLACGCAPLHLKTFLHAQLQVRLSRHRGAITEGIYGDVCGTLERAASQSLDAVALVLEWSDLDSRLGYRSAAAWSGAAAADIPRSAEAVLERISTAIERLDSGVRISVSLPSLPLPPMFYTGGAQASPAELELDLQLARFASRLAARPNLAVAHPRRTAEEAATGGRHDLKSDLLIGFPYTLPQADALASAHARLLVPAAPKKGIITDLDDTLWSGIAGEVGPQGVSWDLNSHHHLHALYQNLLASLAGHGVLVGAASKNDAEVVKDVFRRSDILLPAERVFPFEIHWQAKSASVGRILKAWNIAASDVIFVDDSPMEMAEVEAAHPGIECLQFPGNDYAAAFALLRRIRDLCGRERLTGEDEMRLDSIRRGAEFQKRAAEGAVSDTFLEQADAEVTFDFSPSPDDARVLDLVNKTNQFNLNGIRRGDADWRNASREPGAVVGVVSYHDKFGPLGKIAVIQGCRVGSTLEVKTWVMSCRAFSRRVEHQCLRVLFDRLDITGIVFDFAATPRNGPVQDFFAAFSEEALSGPVTLSREQFDSRCPALFHRLVIHGGLAITGAPPIAACNEEKT